MVAKNVKRVATATKRLQTKRKRLVGKKKDIVSQIKEVDQEIKTSSKRGPVRPPKVSSRPGPKLGMKRIDQKSLVVFVKRVMKPGQKMAVKDVADKVKKAGYRTRQKNMTFFRATVGVALKNTSGIKKAGRGHFIFRPARANAKVKASQKGSKRRATAVA